MKKKLFLPVLILLLCFLVPVPLAAADEVPLVYDEAFLLSDNEYYELNNRAEEISNRYACEIRVVVLEDMAGSNAYEVARNIYEDYDFGYGADKSGLLLMLSMAARDYALVAYGYGNTAFTDYGKDVLMDTHVLPLLADNEYYKAFSAYLDTADEYLKMAREGTPFDEATDPEKGKKSFWIRLAVTLLLPLLVAGAVCGFLVQKMKSAVTQRQADEYIAPGGFALAVQQDYYLFRTQTRTRIEKPSGGTSVDSRGFSGKSGKF